MKAITIRNLPPEVERAIEERAREKGTSINKTVAGLLEASLDTKGKPGRTVYHDLDRFAGRWTAREDARFRKTLKDQRKTDREMWS